MNHKGTVVMETERLILHPLKESDADDMYYNWDGQNSNPENYQWCLK